MNEELIVELGQLANNKNLITYKELVVVIVKYNEGIKRSTIAKLISNLILEGKIVRISKGIYSLLDKKHFEPTISNRAKRLYNVVKEITNVEIWETDTIREIIKISYTPRIIFILTSKNDLESVYNSLNGFSKPVVLYSDVNVINKFVENNIEFIVIAPIISETPVVLINGYATLSLEALLINYYYLLVVICDYDFSIFEDVFRLVDNAFVINEGRLIRYASRRNKLKEFKKMINCVKYAK